jgi:GTP-binding protein Era
MAISNQFRAGYSAIIGKPNVGKSTLMNGLLDFKLSIISPRPQTTRRRVMGIINKPSYQIVFLDTPGLIDPKYRLQKVLGTFIASSILDADVLLYLVECKIDNDYNRIIIEEEVQKLSEINPQKKPVILIINKIDLFSKDKLLPLMDRYAALYPFKNLIPVSALKRDGLKELEIELEQAMPLHPPFYDPDVLTEQPERFFVAEFIREQIFLHFQEEIPYSTEVQIEEFIERDNSKDLIHAVIHVERDSQKGIIIGKKGSTIKNIGIQSRKVIEKFLDREVYLEIRVKVSKNWRKDEQQIKRFGY